MELNEVAAKAPESLPETEHERVLRERAEWFYLHSNPSASLSKYAAGWIAAKAHYETKQ